MTNPTCETCRWWHNPKPTGDHGEDAVGECHGAPPTAKDRYIIWPITTHSDFCGQHEPRDEGGE